MKIVVCVKQVPSVSEVKLDPVTNTIIRDGSKSVINPYDCFALEAAVQIKESHGGEAIALSMGIPAVQNLLTDAVSRGADRAVLLSDRAFAGADTLATSYTLAMGIEKLGGADLILCGKMAIDGDTAQIGPELAEWLGIPHLTDVVSFEKIAGDHLIVKRIVDDGYQILKVCLPAVICVVKDINMPRMPSIAGIRYSLLRDVTVWNAADLQADESRIGMSGSPTQVVRTYTPELAGSTRPIEDSAAEIASSIAGIIREVI